MTIRDKHLNSQGEMTPERIWWRVQADTASRTLTEEDFGKLLTNRGAGGAVVWTLPSPRPEYAGASILFYSVQNNNITVAGSGSTDLVALNDANAASVAYGAVPRIGGGFEAVCDGTQWLMIAHHWDNGATAQPITVT